MTKAKSFRPDSQFLTNKIYGIDFSGAKNAGIKIWIASAIISGNIIEIDDCCQVKHLPGLAADRDQCFNDSGVSITSNSM